MYALSSKSGSEPFRFALFLGDLRWNDPVVGQPTSYATNTADTSVTSMLQDLDWPLLEQRRAESRLTLFHRIVHKEVDVNENVLMERIPRASRKGNSVQFRRPQTSNDCFKYSFIPHTISQWNAIPAGLICHSSKPKSSLVVL